jgi:hypothetical protein
MAVGYDLHVQADDIAAIVHPRSPYSPRFLVRARRPSSGGGGGSLPGAGACYGDAADRQRDRANGGLPRRPHSPRFLVHARGGRHQGAAAGRGRGRVD